MAEENEVKDMTPGELLQQAITNIENAGLEEEADRIRDVATVYINLYPWAKAYRAGLTAEALFTWLLDQSFKVVSIACQGR